ncbi:MAG: ABC transporter permease [Vicinamibacterales bacterium]
MNWRAYVRSHLPPLGVSPEREIEIVEELAGQLESTYDRARSNGAGEAAATTLAAAEVPDWTALARTLGAIERPFTPHHVPGAPSRGFMTGTAGDVRDGIRGLARAPIFALVSVLTVALVLGSGAAAFSVLDKVLLQPLPFASPDRLVLLHATVPPEGRDTVETTYLDGQDLAAESSVVQSALLVIPYAGTTTTLDPPELLTGFELSVSAFAVLGVQPILGRAFSTGEGEPGHNLVAILGYGLWQRLGGRADAIGQTILLDETPRTIVGVLPARFRLEVLTAEGDVYLPLTRDHFAAGSRDFRAFRTLIRLQPGVSIEQANAVATTVGDRLARAFPDTNGGRAFFVRPLQEEIIGGVRPALLLVAGLLALVLSIAGVNLTNLLLARAVSRSRELAVRAALGASTWRLARASMVEAGILATAGALSGAAIARTIIALLTTTPGIAVPRLAEVALDWRAAGMLGLTAIVAAVVIGLAPFVLRNRLHATAALRTGHETAGRRARRVRSALVIGQTSLAFMLLASATFLTLSLHRLLALPSGFDAGVSTMRVSAPAARYRDRAATVRFFNDLLSAVRQQPGVQAAGLVSLLPLSGNAGSTLSIQGRDDIPIASRPSIGWQYAAPGYFATMGIPLIRGRDFVPADLENLAHVTVINEALARQFFPGEDPIGRRVYFGGVPAGGISDWHGIIGVVGDVRHRNLEGEPDARAYDLFGQHWGRTVSLAIRSTEPPARVAGAVRTLVASRDPLLAVFAVRTTEELVDGATRPRRLLSWLVSSFALAGLAVALLGVYGIVAFMVAERRREVGVRVALGASAASIRGLVVGHGLRLVALGLVFGAAGAAAFRKGIESQLFGVAPTDIPVLAAVAGALLAAAALPCFVVARRAVRIDPVSALRSE